MTRAEHNAYAREWYRNNRRSKKPQKHPPHRCTACDNVGHNSRTCPIGDRQ